MSRPSKVYVGSLTEEEHLWAQRIYHHTTDATLQTRCHIILHYSILKIAALLFYSEDTVARTTHEFNQAGLQGIIPQSKGGYQRKIETPHQHLKPYGAGVIHWISGQLHWAVNEHKDNALLHLALLHLLSSTASPDDTPPRKKYVIVDNYCIHFVKPMREWGCMNSL